MKNCRQSGAGRGGGGRAVGNEATLDLATWGIAICSAFVDQNITLGPIMPDNIGYESEGDIGSVERTQFAIVFWMYDARDFVMPGVVNPGKELAKIILPDGQKIFLYRCKRMARNSRTVVTANGLIGLVPGAVSHNDQV